MALDLVDGADPMSERALQRGVDGRGQHARRSFASPLAFAERSDPEPGSEQFDRLLRVHAAHLHDEVDDAAEARANALAGAACVLALEPVAHDRLLRFLRDSPWEGGPVRLFAAEYAIAAMTQTEPIRTWVIDDTGFLKQGNHAVGVQRQYTGSAGKVTNCQVAVSLSVATRSAHVPIDFELYLPEPWMANALAFRSGTALYKLHLRPARTLLRGHRPRADRAGRDRSGARRNPRGARQNEDGGRVTRAMFEQNLAGKKLDTVFTADMTPLLASGRTWSFEAAYDRVWHDLLGRLPGEPWKGA